MQKNVMSARGRTILYAVLILFAVIQVYPIIWVILQSIKTTEELTNLSALSLPSSLYTGHFKKALEVSTIPRSFLNSTIVAVVTLTLEVAICCPFAFAVRKLRWKGGEKVFNFVLLGMMIPVFWTLDTLDWKVKNTDRIVREVLEDVEENDVILMHDSYRTTVEAALRIVDELQKKGYEFVTADELILE